MVESLNERKTAIEITAAGIDVATVRPIFSPAYTFAAVRITVISAPRMIPRIVSSLMLSSVLTPSPFRAIAYLSPYASSAGFAVARRSGRRVPADRLPALVHLDPDVGQQDAILDHPAEIFEPPFGLDGADH